jgi:hypothetical protein
LGLVVAAVLGTFGALICVSRHVYAWRLLGAILPLFVGALAVYSMTYFLTILARSGEKGLSYGLGILVVSLFLPLVELQLNPWLWHLSHGHALHLSSVLSLMWRGCGWVIALEGGFPTGALVFYGLLTLAFPFAAQLFLERAEV